MGPEVVIYWLWGKLSQHCQGAYNEAPMHEGILLPQAKVQGRAQSSTVCLSSSNDRYGMPQHRSLLFRPLEITLERDAKLKTVQLLWYFSIPIMAPKLYTLHPNTLNPKPLTLNSKLRL